MRITTHMLTKRVENLRTKQNKSWNNMVPYAMEELVGSNKIYEFYILAL